MILTECIDEFLLYLEAVRGLSPNTVLGYKKDLEFFKQVKFISPQADIKDVTVEQIRLCIGELSKQNKSAASINRFLAAVRSLFAYCKKFGYIEFNNALEVKTVKLPKRLPNFMTGQEVDKICAAPEKNELLWQKRDTALFEMLYSSGCRISEIAGLKLSDFKPDLSSAVVLGKGSKMRNVYFAEDAKKALKEYLEDRKNRFGDNKVLNPKNYIFVNQKGSPMTTEGLRFILSKYSGSEGTKHHLNPHAFRHTFATTMLSNGADVRMVQELLGHSSISTTQRYTHISTDQLIDLYNQAHPHGGRK